MVALGYAATPYVTTTAGIYLTLGLMAIAGSIASSFLCHSMFLPHWFVRRRGLAIGIAFSGVGIGSVLILPWFQALIDGAGWRAACFSLAALVAVVVIPLNLLFQRRRPEDIGQHPDGDTQDEVSAEAVSKRLDPVIDRAWADTEWTLGRAARTARFWWVFLAYFTSLFAWYAVQVHQTKYLIESGFDSRVAATALGLVGLCGIVGQIGLGQFSDRVGREWTWSIAMSGYIVCYGLLLALDGRPSLPLLYLMVAAQGLLGYGLASIYGAVTAELFMGRHYATIFSITSLGGNVGAAAGPWLFGVIYDVGGSYTPAFWLAIGGCVASIACMWLAAPGKVRMVAGVAARRRAAAAAE
jgi:MFS family permease